MESEDVLEAKIVSGLQISLNFSYQSLFKSKFSITASTTKSTFANFEASDVNVIDCNVRFAFSSDIFPFETILCNDDSIFFFPLSRDSLRDSKATTDV